MRWQRLRKWARWTCTLAAVLAVGAAAFSGFYMLRGQGTCLDGTGVWLLRLRSGLLEVRRGNDVSYLPSIRVGWWTVRRTSGWRWGLMGEDSVFNSDSLWHGGITWSRRSSGWIAGTSLIYPVLLTTIPAALLWYTERRRFGPHACRKCGYDRRGLVGGADAKCPECGTVPTPTPTPTPIK